MCWAYRRDTPAITPSCLVVVARKRPFPLLDLGFRPGDLIRAGAKRMREIAVTNAPPERGSTEAGLCQNLGHAQQAARRDGGAIGGQFGFSWRCVSVRASFQASNAWACAGQRSFSGAGETVQREQIGLSQVPLLPLSTFQSHARSARRPHPTHFLREPDEQTIAVPPSGNATRSQLTGASLAVCGRWGSQRMGLLAVAGRRRHHRSGNATGRQRDRRHG